MNIFEEFLIRNFLTHMQQVFLCCLNNNVQGTTMDAEDYKYLCVCVCGTA
jgi:hypothetical protein